MRLWRLVIDEVTGQLYRGPEIIMNTLQLPASEPTARRAALSSEATSPPPALVLGEHTVQLYGDVLSVGTTTEPPNVPVAVAAPEAWLTWWHDGDRLLRSVDPDNPDRQHPAGAPIDNDAATAAGSE